jgi:hypothetical protein
VLLLGKGKCLGIYNGAALRKLQAEGDRRSAGATVTRSVEARGPVRGAVRARYIRRVAGSRAAGARAPRAPPAHGDACL